MSNWPTTISKENPVSRVVADVEETLTVSSVSMTRLCSFNTVSSTANMSTPPTERPLMSTVSRLGVDAV